MCQSLSKIRNLSIASDKKPPVLVSDKIQPCMDHGSTCFGISSELAFLDALEDSCNTQSGKSASHESKALAKFAATSSCYWLKRRQSMQFPCVLCIILLEIFTLILGGRQGSSA